MKMSIDCPHSELELHVAALGLIEKLKDKETQQAILNAGDEHKTVGTDTAKNRKEQAAEYHGITVKDLIDSPNYEKLIKEFVTHTCRKLMSSFKSHGFTDKEAWCLLMGVAGLSNQD